MKSEKQLHQEIVSLFNVSGIPFAYEKQLVASFDIGSDVRAIPDFIIYDGIPRAIVEVKSDTKSQSIFTALGQCLVYSQLLLLKPNQCIICVTTPHHVARRIADAIKELGIAILAPHELLDAIRQMSPSLQSPAEVEKMLAK